MVRRAHLIVVLGVLLIGCAVLLLLGGCAGMRSEAPQEEKQGHTEATKKEQGRSPQATESEQARCDGTRTTKVPRMGEGIYTTNDLPGCPKGGLLLGTNKADKLYGGEGDDEIRGLGAKDEIAGGDGNDVIYAGLGDDSLWDGKGDDVIYGGDGDDGEILDDRGDDVIHGGAGDDYFVEDGGANVIYGGDGNDYIEVIYPDGPPAPDKFYCGKGKDDYALDGFARMAKNDYVDSSCEKKIIVRGVI